MTNLDFFDNRLKVFAISPRTLDTDDYVRNIRRTIYLSDKYHLTGILIFTGNDTFIDPWMVAQLLLEKSTRLSPLVAVNPCYMHPFSVAKMISSLSLLYKRKIYVNCVTGTSIKDLNSLGAFLEHDERYERLTEYLNIVDHLVTSRVPLRLKGNYYDVDQLLLRPPVPENLHPSYFVAGKSEPARKLALQLDGTHIRMGKAKSDLANEFLVDPSINEGSYFGVITRESSEDAWLRAEELFPVKEEGQELLDYSMKNTDAVWKKDLHKNPNESNKRDSYFIRPFKNFQADCPYYVGSHEDIARIFASYLDLGIETFVIDTPAEEIEYQNINSMFGTLQKKYMVSRT